MARDNAPVEWVEEDVLPSYSLDLIRPFIFYPHLVYESVETSAQLFWPYDEWVGRAWQVLCAGSFIPGALTTLLPPLSSGGVVSGDQRTVPSGQTV